MTSRFLLLSLLLAGCSPPPTPVVVSWEDRFQQAHGSTYDPNSRVDREKMAALKGEATVKEPLPVAPVVADSLATREAILAVARPLVGQTETHGSNRSFVIDAMNRLTGVAMGSPYCASLNAWCYSEGKAPAGWPKSAWSPDWVKSPTWTSTKGGKTPQPADAFGIWFSNKGRVAHTGLVERWEGASAVTIEGNTSPSAEFGAASDRDGDGIWRKRRLSSQIHSVRDWVGD